MNRVAGYSVVGGGETFPTIVGKLRWTDERTFVARLRLEPVHDYELGINGGRFRNFRGEGGESAVPYPIRFHTRPGAETSRGRPIARRSSGSGMPSIETIPIATCARSTGMPPSEQPLPDCSKRRRPSVRQGGRGLDRAGQGPSPLLQGRRAGLRAAVARLREEFRPGVVEAGNPRLHPQEPRRVRGQV